MNTAMHIVSESLHDLLFTAIVDALRAKDFRMIGLNRGIRFHRVVDAINKRKIFRPNADADYLGLAIHQFVVGTCAIVRIRRLLMSGS